MPNDECPNCSGHPKLDCIRDHFSSKVAKLLQDALEEVRVGILEETEEIKDRKEAFPLELADHILWVAASIYVGERAPNSEAIYELAKALEEMDSEVEVMEVDEPKPSLASNKNVN
jgi:hypothetical protein